VSKTFSGSITWFNQLLLFVFLFVGIDSLQKKKKSVKFEEGDSTENMVKKIYSFLHRVAS
jgi:hypothetical protein